MTTIDFATSCACFNLRKAARAITSLYDEALRPAGIRATQLTLLMGIAAAEQPTISQLAELLVMDRTTLARDLKPLAAQGLVTIVAGDDRRTRLVQLTVAGRHTLNDALPLWHQAQTRMITDGLGRDEWHALYGALQDVVRIARA
jgi:DNA-binding MarR family transcriptional regulator